VTRKTGVSRLIHVSMRESRMCVDRILLVVGLPSGYVAAVRECVLLSQALRLGGFAHLLAHHGELSMAPFQHLQLTDHQDASVSVDGAGMHAWLLAPTLTDLAVDVARRNGHANFQVRRVIAAGEMHTVAALAVRHGAVAHVAVSAAVGGDAPCATIELSNAPRPRTAEQCDPLLFAAMRDGFAVDEPLWRAIHALSNAALAPDSVVSRRHAGPVILQDDGSIFGRPPADDDFDFNMLRNVAPAATENAP
jgi:hypothetical protein